MLSFGKFHQAFLSKLWSNFARPRIQNTLWATFVQYSKQWRVWSNFSAWHTKNKQIPSSRQRHVDKMRKCCGAHCVSKKNFRVVKEPRASIKSKRFVVKLVLKSLLSVGNYPTSLQRFMLLKIQIWSQKSSSIANYLVEMLVTPQNAGTMILKVLRVINKNLKRQ